MDTDSSQEQQLAWGQLKSESNQNPPIFTPFIFPMRRLSSAEDFLQRGKQ